MHRGYLRQWRKELESEVFLDPDAMLYKVWSWCKMKANWKPGTVASNEIKPGQFVTSVAHAAELFHISRQALIRRLDRLKSMGSISINADNHRTTITLCNWATYEDLDSQNGDLSDNERYTQRTTSVTPTGHNQRREEGKEEKNGILPPLADKYSQPREVPTLHPPEEVEPTQRKKPRAKPSKNVPAKKVQPPVVIPSCRSTIPSFYKFGICGSRIAEKSKKL